MADAKESKSRRKQPSKTPGGKPAKKLDGVRRIQAKLVVQSLIGQIRTKHEIVMAVCDEFECTESVAETLWRDAWNDFKQADERAKPERQAIIMGRLEELYRQTMEAGKHGYCLEILKQQAKIWGVDKPVRQAIVPTVEDEFDGRDEEELEFFSRHGCWPEEYQPPPEPKKEDGEYQLTKLH